MHALFIGHTYIDVTIVTGHVPVGDEKGVASEYAVSFGGNAVTAAFCCAKLGIKPDLIATGADDWLGRMFWDMARKYELELHVRKVRRSSLSFVMPHAGERAILRARDDKYLHPFPVLDLTGCRALHIDGHQPDAALHYARACREAGILTSLDGGGVRVNTHEVLALIDVAIVSERFCQQLKMTTEQTLDYLAERGCRIGGVTHGERGLRWYDERGRRSTLPALPIPRAELSIPAAPATCFTARMCIPISAIREAMGGAFPVCARAPPTRCSVSGTKPACPLGQMLRRCSASSAR
jgi:sugar/nucleoside kinase (ribokinase family)